MPEWRVNHEFVATTCKVLDKRIGERTGEDGPLFRPEIKIEYEVGGATYRDWHYDVHQHQIDGGYSSGRENAQADPRPIRRLRRGEGQSLSVLVRSDESVRRRAGARISLVALVAFTVPASFMLIGAGGLIYTLLQWGKSAEQRAVMSQRVQERDFFGAGGGPRPLILFVPRGRHDQQPRHTAALPSADDHLARLGTVRRAGVLRGLERVSVFAAIADRAAHWPAGRTGS